MDLDIHVFGAQGSDLCPIFVSPPYSSFTALSVPAAKRLCESKKRHHSLATGHSQTVGLNQSQKLEDLEPSTRNRRIFRIGRVHANEYLLQSMIASHFVTSS